MTFGGCSGKQNELMEKVQLINGRAVKTVKISEGKESQSHEFDAKRQWAGDHSFDSCR